MSDRLTAAQLAEIEARAKAATPGEWEAFGLFGNEAHVWVNGRLIASGLTRNDARLVAHARTDIPALLRDLRAAREALEESAAQFEHYERLHREKRTTDDNLKALVNWGFAQFARAALPEETPSGE